MSPIGIFYLDNTLYLCKSKSFVVDGKNSDESGYIEHETQAEPRVNVITGLVCSGSGFYQRMQLYFYCIFYKDFLE